MGCFLEEFQGWLLFQQPLFFDLNLIIGIMVVVGVKYKK